MTIARTRKLAWLLTPATVGLTWIVAACDTTDHVSGLTRQPALSALIVRSVNVSDLGILAGHSGGSALDVNRSGQAVGFSFDDAEVDWTFDTGFRGTFWAMQAAFPHMRERGGRIINFASWYGVTGNAGTVGYNITKEAIRVVGKMSEPPSQKKLPALSTAVLWQDGVMGTLDLPVGSDYVYEVHMNDAGQVVATVWNSTEKSVRSFFLGGSGTTDLGSLGGRVTWAHAINAAGQVVGTSLTAEGDPHPFLWESGQMRDLGGLGGSWGSRGSTTFHRSSDTIGFPILPVYHTGQHRAFC